MVGFLEEVTRNPELLTQERKAAANIVRWGLGLDELGWAGGWD